MRSRGPASRADRSDPLPLPHRIAQFHVDSGKMQESAAEAVAMVYHQQTPFQSEGVIGGQYDHAIGRRNDRFSGRANYIDSAVIRARHALIYAL